MGFESPDWQREKTPKAATATSALDGKEKTVFRPPERKPVQLVVDKGESRHPPLKAPPSNATCSLPLNLEAPAGKKKTI
jgi:hypothetical protein